MYVHMYVEARHNLHKLSIFLFNKGLPLDSESHKVDEAVWLESFRDLPGYHWLAASLALELEAHTTTPDFYLGIGNKTQPPCPPLV